MLETISLIVEVISLPFTLVGTALGIWQFCLWWKNRPPKT